MKWKHVERVHCLSFYAKDFQRLTRIFAPTSNVLSAVPILLMILLMPLDVFPCSSMISDWLFVLPNRSDPFKYYDGRSYYPLNWYNAERINETRLSPGSYRLSWDNGNVYVFRLAWRIFLYAHINERIRLINIKVMNWRVCVCAWTDTSRVKWQFR